MIDGETSGEIDHGLVVLVVIEHKNNNDDIEWHKENLRNYLSEQEDFSFPDHTNAFAKDYTNEHTSIPYMTGALLCEYIIDNYSKETLFKMFRERKPLWEA